MNISNDIHITLIKIVFLSFKTLIEYWETQAQNIYHNLFKYLLIFLITNLSSYANNYYLNLVTIIFIAILWLIVIRSCFFCKRTLYIVTTIYLSSKILILLLSSLHLHHQIFNESSITDQADFMIILWLIIIYFFLIMWVTVIFIWIIFILIII